MTSYSRDAGKPGEEGIISALYWDAKILRDALREAILTSPDSFLTTVEDVDTKSLDYWIGEMRSSTWAVTERQGDVVGVAAAKRPDPHKDKEDQATTRYIESVWICPDLRGRRLSERLIRYLLEAEYRKNQDIRHFLLWVFTNNSPAIRLYEDMGFVRTPDTNRGIRTEIKYHLNIDREVYAAVHLAVNDAARRQDERQYGVTYRILGGKDSA
jgi:ribosomal protein S18 acetylase RimI-like enzyme